MWGYSLFICVSALSSISAGESSLPFSPILINTTSKHVSHNPGCWAFVRGSPSESRKIYSHIRKKKAYLSNRNCIRLLSASRPDQRIKLSISDYFIEDSPGCKYDSLRIQDGPFQFSKTLRLICGKGGKTVIYSTSRYMRLVFKTDEYIQRSGFEIDWEEEPNPNMINGPNSACYFYIPITDRQGQLNISVSAASQLLQNRPDPLDTELDCVWDIHNTQNSEKVWIWLHHISQQTVHKCSDRSIEIVSIEREMFLNNHVESKRCYQVATKIFPGSNRVLIRVYAKDSNAFPQFTLNVTTFTEPIVGLAKCDSKLYTCEDGRLCLDESLVCNGLVNCPDADDESIEACENKWLEKISLQWKVNNSINYENQQQNLASPSIEVFIVSSKQFYMVSPYIYAFPIPLEQVFILFLSDGEDGHSLVLQFIFGGATCLFLIVVCAVLVFSGRKVIRHNKKLATDRHGKETIIANLRPLRLLQQTTVRLINTSDQSLRANSDRLSDIRGSNSSICTGHGSRHGSLNSYHGSITRHGSFSRHGSFTRHSSVKCHHNREDYSNKRRRSTVFLSPELAQEMNILQSFKT